MIADSSQRRIWEGFVSALARPVVAVEPDFLVLSLLLHRCTALSPTYATCVQWTPVPLFSARDLSTMTQRVKTAASTTKPYFLLPFFFFGRSVRRGLPTVSRVHLLASLA